MADNSSQQGNDTIRTLDRSGIKTQQFGFDVAQSGESELPGLGDSRIITLTSAGLTTTSPAYATGDQVGTEMSASMTRTAKGLIVWSAELIDKAKVLGLTDLYAFQAATTPAADNATNSWSDADMVNLLGIIHFAEVATSANNYTIAATNLPLLLKPSSGTTLYFDLVTRTANAVFGAVGDVVINLGVTRD